ncbi:MAG: hypothetical protein ABIR66_01025 [Saprospiraceae bacterium]
MRSFFIFFNYGHAEQEITEGKKVCVSIYKSGKLYTVSKAVDFGCEYQSIILYGTIRIIENEDERMSALASFYNKFFSHIPKEDFESFTPILAEPIHIAKFKIEKCIMKERRVPDLARHSFHSEISLSL